MVGTSSTIVIVFVQVQNTTNKNYEWNAYNNKYHYVYLYYTLFCVIVLIT